MLPSPAAGRLPRCPLPCRGAPSPAAGPPRPAPPPALIPRPTRFGSRTQRSHDSLLPAILREWLGDITLPWCPVSLGAATLACKPGEARFKDPEADMIWEFP